MKPFLDVFLFYKVCQLLRHHTYDLVHTHEEAAFFGRIFQRTLGLPHIYDMHSSLPQQLKNFRFSRSRFLFLLFQAFEKSILATANCVITICPELYRYVASLGLTRNLCLIENSLNYSKLWPNGSCEIEQVIDLSQLEGRIKILYTGTFEPYQGIELLIQSARYVTRRFGDRVLFLMVGGKEKQVAHYQRLVEQQALDRYFIFTGMVHPRLADAFVSLSDVLVSPRIHGTNTPLKIYSYLRSGKPIVATRVITHTQVLDDSVAVLTEPGPEDLAQGIIRILEDRRFAQQLVRNAQRLAEERYSYSAYLRDLREALQLALT